MNNIQLPKQYYYYSNNNQLLNKDFLNKYYLLIIYIKNCCLVILDEATAQVDRENDALIQRTLRDTLHGTAILSIAHRLDTIIDFDKVIVVDKGEIVEMGGVYDLIQQRGQFYDMVMKTGDEMSQRLIQMAKDCVPTE
ncbi:P-loop NTPase family protein [Spironucleus salmonicida]|uniref:ABC transporter domain-containing protein n=2 Tax=Spironucleus TaxID=39709 RepID=V6LHQ6_9EUKA|nr:P-loop NTPase family protein [Spironucleus salmonicida]|eukprot:EST43833.1 ABC transporter domain-containing protein [Spironucleus salmonicida]